MEKSAKVPNGTLRTYGPSCALSRFPRRNDQSKHKKRTTSNVALIKTLVALAPLLGLLGT